MKNYLLILLFVATTLVCSKMCYGQTSINISNIDSKAGNGSKAGDNLVCGETNEGQYTSSSTQYSFTDTYFQSDKNPSVGSRTKYGYKEYYFTPAVSGSLLYIVTIIITMTIMTQNLSFTTHMVQQIKFLITAMTAKQHLQQN